MTTSPPTTKQKEILFLLYKFRYLNTNQLRIILNHKNSNRILEWLRDLIDKKYIGRIYSRKSFESNTKPAIYHLDTKARKHLKTNPICKQSLLNYLYKEKSKEDKFISHNITLADIYLFFLSRKKENEEVHFFTKSTLGYYEHFPQTNFDAYIAVKKKESTKRYFLHLFDEDTPVWVYRDTVRKYLQFIDTQIWEEKTNSPVPTILIVCPNERKKSHIYLYSKSMLEKTFNEINIYVTTQKIINSKDSNQIWAKVK